ncbi:MAG TPA: hypothetical protein V6D17_18995 [Candidatus Obscuribacterales bacterium]
MTMSRPGLELGVRYYDNSARSGSILGGDRGLLKDYGFRERARSHRATMIGDTGEYSGLRFASRSENSEVRASRRQTMSRLRKKETRLHFWKSVFSYLNPFTLVSAVVSRLNPFTSYHSAARWSVR